jgi:hypothetical protein
MWEGTDAKNKSQVLNTNPEIINFVGASGNRWNKATESFCGLYFVYFLSGGGVLAPQKNFWGHAER